MQESFTNNRKTFCDENSPKEWDFLRHNDKKNNRVSDHVTKGCQKNHIQERSFVGFSPGSHDFSIRRQVKWNFESIRLEKNVVVGEPTHLFPRKRERK